MLSETIKRDNKKEIEKEFQILLHNVESYLTFCHNHLPFPPFDPFAPVFCHGISPSRCRDEEAGFADPGGLIFPAVPNLVNDVSPASPLLTLTLPDPIGVAGLASEAARLNRLGAIAKLLLDCEKERSTDPLPDDLLLMPIPATGFNAGFKAGTISLANSRTSTAPSPPPLLNFSTTPNSPYRSTSIARFGCTSQTPLKMRSKLSRTTALLFCPSRSIIRLKNADDLVIAIVTGVDNRVIFKNGSSKFSNELALAVTKHLRSASMASVFNSSSSTRAVSSWSQDSTDSKALTWKYGSSSNLKYMVRPSCCHSSVRQLFPALAKSHRIGSANCFSGELVSMTRFKQGMMPACAASS